MIAMIATCEYYLGFPTDSMHASPIHSYLNKTCITSSRSFLRGIFSYTCHTDVSVQLKNFSPFSSLKEIFSLLPASPEFGRYREKNLCCQMNRRTPLSDSRMKVKTNLAKFQPMPLERVIKSNP